MPRYIDIVGSDIVTNPALAKFTVNTGVPEVAVSGVGAGPPVGIPFAGGLGFPSDIFWEPRDQLILKRLWVKTPHGFRQGTGTGAIVLSYVVGVTTYPLAEMGATGSILIPGICDSLDFPPDGLLMSPSASGVPGGPTANRFRLFLNTIQGFTVSMAGVPTILNGLDFNLQFFLEILHTRPISNVP